MLNILFVCMGNICRSPAAEAIMKKIVKKEELSDKINCDSAGTIGYHEGEKADERMIRYAANRGINITSISRKIRPDDMIKFDYIVAMDDDNLKNIINMDPNGKFRKKIFKMTQFSSDKRVREVPDPYYGGSQGFENVLNILEDSCKNFLSFIKKENEM